MKQNILTLAVMTIFSSLALAQSDLATSVGVRTNESYQKGFQVGLDYMNITDASIKIDGTSTSYQGDLHLGIAGIKAGYTQTPEYGLGFDVGASYVESFNKSETSGNSDDSKWTFLIPSLNLTGAFNKYITGYVGGNVGIMTGPNAIKEYLKPDLGAQIGLGVRFNPNLSLQAGYRIIRQIISIKFHNGYYEETVLGNMSLGGFNSNMTYTF
jgi:hypothetical protein